MVTGLFLLEKDFLELDPALRFRAARDGIEHALRFHALFETRLHALSRRNSAHEIRDHVHERVFVADDMAGRPPILHIRMGRFGHKYITKTLSILRIAPAEKF